jgi:hypothetical protein
VAIGLVSSALFAAGALPVAAASSITNTATSAYVCIQWVGEPTLLFVITCPGAI